MTAPKTKRTSSPPMRRFAPPPPPPQPRWVEWAKWLAAGGAAMAAALLIMTYIGEIAESGPLPVPSRAELTKVEKDHDARDMKLQDGLDQTLAQFKQLNAQQSVLNAEAQRRNIRGLQTALDAARLKAKASRDQADRLLVDTLQDQLDKAVKEAGQ